MQLHTCPVSIRNLNGATHDQLMQSHLTGTGCFDCACADSARRLGPARIEGEHTTPIDYVEARLEGAPDTLGKQLQDMAKYEEAMRYIEERFGPGPAFSEHVRSDLHALAVGDGSKRAMHYTRLGAHSRGRLGVLLSRRTARTASSIADSADGSAVCGITAPAARRAAQREPCRSLQTAGRSMSNGDR